VQDQPVVGIAAEWLGNDLFKLGFDLFGSLARRKPGPVADAEYVGVDCKRFLTKGGVEHDVCRLAADAGQGLELLAGAGHFAAKLIDQRLAQRDDILGLGVEQADRLDCLPQPVLAQCNHLLRRPDILEQRPRRDVDARVRRLRGKHHCDEQCIGIGIVELGSGGGVSLRQAPEKFENFRFRHSEPITSRIE
jgi:hypothetical protein